MYARFIAIICSIFVLANGDAFDDIRIEEEVRNNETVSTFVRAAFAGELKRLFPGVTAQETEDAEKWYACVYRFGDPSNPLPDNEEKIELELCRDHRDKGTKILEYIRKRYPTHLILQISTHIAMRSYGFKNDEYCRDAVSKRVYTKNAAVINQQINELNRIRNEFLNNSLVIVHGTNTTSSKLAILCCTSWRFRSDALNALPTQETKDFFSNNFDSYHGESIQYLCGHKTLDSKACDGVHIPSPPANVPPFKSILSAAVGILQSLTPDIGIN